MRPAGFHALDVHGALRAVQAAAAEQGGGRTALHAAAEFGHAEAARMLLAHGMSPSTPDARGETALHVAARHGHGDVAHLLLAAGADPGARDADGLTPAETANGDGHAALAKQLASRPSPRPARRSWWRWLRGWWRRRRGDR